ncbi:hypothetical protein [Pseudorhodoferax aquiterrae]|uniref:hypothetical protein n=1 Tax=Pseudorhodoferax aquiterrae TaxID=747304 RepID=UPI0016754CF2|nr:hypothetical protein [Pseudorhodoferax aquiterrae]
MTFPQHAAALEMRERFFERKRLNLLDDYGLRDVPSLVWQMASEAPRSIDLFNADVAQSIRAGSATASDGWWHGFKGPQGPAMVLDGLASHDKDRLAGYVTELHSDGHFLAAIWRFPEQVGRLPCVATFYADAFMDAWTSGGAFCTRLESMKPSLPHAPCSEPRSFRLPTSTGCWSARPHDLHCGGLSMPSIPIQWKTRNVRWPASSCGSTVGSGVCKEKRWPEDMAKPMPPAGSSIEAVSRG